MGKRPSLSADMWPLGRNAIDFTARIAEMPGARQQAVR